MAGAMRRMGVYLGLVEDDDARGGYDRYAARQSDHDAEYDDTTAATTAATTGTPPTTTTRTRRPATPVTATATPAATAPAGTTPTPGRRRSAERAPEPEVSLGRRPATPRTLGLAGRRQHAAARLGGGGSAPPAGRASAPRPAAAGSPRFLRRRRLRCPPGLAMSEPVAVEPAPEPKPEPEPSRRLPDHHRAPASYNEARTIGERFRDGMPVIMNLTDMEHADAKRLVDFAIGLTFGLHGSIERVTAKVFLLSPQDVDVTAEDKARIREGGFFSQS